MAGTPPPKALPCSAHSEPTVPSRSPRRHGGGWGTWESDGDSEAELEHVNTHAHTHLFSFTKTGSHCTRDTGFHCSLTAGALGAGSSHVPARPSSACLGHGEWTRPPPGRPE